MRAGSSPGFRATLQPSRTGLEACPSPGLTNTWPISEPDPPDDSVRIFSVLSLPEAHGARRQKPSRMKEGALAEVRAKPGVAIDGCVTSRLFSNHNLLGFPWSVPELCSGVRDKEVSPSPYSGQLGAPENERLLCLWLEHNSPATKPKERGGKTPFLSTTLKVCSSFQRHFVHCSNFIKILILNLVRVLFP